ncbi:AMP-binding protein [Amycolatopsis anabasis]|uniref:AMP-binding protein n=1 Tax=Amycolatopsis anabasis TaxID=1840409 RepID=UPI001FE5A40D|nr:AMP-binding protein [Amycolatopsis anabasis]
MTLGPAYSTLVEGLVESAQRRPYEVTFFPATNEAIDLGVLDESSALCAAGFLDKRLQAGTVIGFLASSNVSFLVRLFGALRAGAAVAVLPARPGRHTRAEVMRLVDIIRTTRIRHLVVSPGFDELARELCSECRELSVIWITPASARTPLPPIYPEQIAFVQFTSGRAGAHKGVALNHGQVMSSIHALRSAAGLTVKEVMAHWLPVYQHIGLFSLLGQIVAGASSHIFAPELFHSSPDRLLQYLARRRVAVTIGPDSSYEFLTDAMASGRAGSLDLSRWRVALNGGEPVRPETVERFMDTFADSGVSKAAMTPTYQLAEATLAVTCKRPGTAPLTLRIDGKEWHENGAVHVASPAKPQTVSYVSAGHPVAGINIRIVDAAGYVVGEGAVGQVQLNGGPLSSGYYRDLPTTMNAWGGGWFRTDDRGFLWNGQLFVTTCHGRSTLFNQELRSAGQ